MITIVLQICLYFPQEKIFGDWWLMKPWLLVHRNAGNSTKYAEKSAEVYTIENMTKQIAEVIYNICW